MAFSARSELPKDAVILSESEAIGYAWQVVSEWKNLSETWALRYSAGILGGMSAICGIIINQHYRTRLRLGRFGHISSILPIVVLPGSLTMVFHKYTVSTTMILNKSEVCPICYELKSAAVQLGFGVVYPMILGPLSAFMFANRYSTYRLPSIATEPKELFKFGVKISKPLKGTLGYMTAFHLVLSSLFTYFELQNTAAVNAKIREIERKIDAGLESELTE